MSTILDIVNQIKTAIMKNPKQCFLYALAGYVVYKISSKIISGVHNSFKQKALIEKGKLAKLQRDERVKKFVAENRNSDEMHKKIISSSIFTLKEYLKNKEVTSKQILISYATRCAEVGLNLNLLADANFVDSLHFAEEADLFMENNEYDKWPPLLGIPFSVKDSIFVKNLISTAGYVARYNRIEKEDAYIIKVMRKLGGIPFVKSNVPQALMAMESFNRLYGEALNPWNPKKTVGGSSGGEGGLVASRCSLFGFGNDIGGSIRIPASFCGVYTIKPSSRRISTQGMSIFSDDDQSGFNQIRVGLGPITRSVDELIYLYQNLFGKFDQDVEINNKPFCYDTFNSTKKLKIGYINTTEICEIANCTLDAINDCIGLLKKNGHELVQFPTTKFKKYFYNYMSILLSCQLLQDVKKGLKDEELIDVYKDFYLLVTLPQWIINLTNYGTYLFGNQRDYELVNNSKSAKTTQDYFEICRLHNTHKAEFQKMWVEEGFDAILCPVTCFPAVNLGNGKYCIHFALYTMFFNYLDLCGGVIPINLASDNEMKPKFNDKYYNGLIQSVKDSIGMPVSIQILSFTNNDELCLRLMKEVDEHFQFDKKHGDKVFDRLQKV